MWATAIALSNQTKAQQDRRTIPTMTSNTDPKDLVGSQTCKTCHEEQFNNFSKTAHSRLTQLNDWKDKMHGCETCHGPGREHVEGGGDITKIRTFRNEPPKQISETCLYCHAGREEHNNFRRGEHWRNDVSCIDCHSPHPGDPVLKKGESITYIGESTAPRPNLSALRMLRTSEPQLCLQCHGEMKAQFTQPFHHKVLEGAMRCSDCHNPHGGFELKQTRLSIGADAPCIKCHTNLQGPFVFEHAPLKIEGCTLCHNPHGSANPRMLKRTEVFQLCLECHTDAHGIGAPNTPNFHNLATTRFRNCTTCHVKIHGSNTHNLFFR
jgi:predicted CXXCH cytochrome family protein